MRRYEKPGGVSLIPRLTMSTQETSTVNCDGVGVFFLNNCQVIDNHKM